MGNLLLVLLLVTAGVLGAQDRGQSFPRWSESYGLTVSYGHAYEKVFRNSQTTDLTSQLDWPVFWNIGATGELKAQWFDVFYSAVNWAVAVSPLSGTQTDDDWNINFETLSNARVHSDSTAFQRANFSCGLELGFPVKPEEFDMDWTSSVGLEYRAFQWEGYGANQVATDPAGSTIYHTYSGIVITYNQQWLIPYLGFKASGVWEDWSWELGLKGSFYLFCLDSDNHVTSKTNYVDQMKGGWMVAPRFSGGYFLSKNQILEVQAQYTYIDGVRGDDYGIAAGTPPTSATLFPNQGGAGLQEWRIGIGLKFFN